MISGEFTTHQYMPHILVSAFKRAEPNADSEQTLSTPSITRGDGHRANILGLAAVDGHRDFLINIGLQ